MILPPDESAPPPAVVQPRTRLKRTGRYRVGEEIARGGMGVVLKGHDDDLGRDVAMKVLRDEHVSNENVVQRFVEEAQIGGQLQHPGIVPVYDLGIGEDDRPYFAMKLVKGRTLSALLQEREELASERHRFLSIFESVCLTIAYAHSRGVIHRDLKPSNIMVGAFGEVQVVDWGLAKVLGQRSAVDEARKHDSSTSVIATVRSTDTGSQSIAGTVFGSPAYMPPEQAQGFIDRIDQRSDVFALGGILCEILTGQPPYVGSGMEALDLAMRGDLGGALARLAACDADEELVAIARRCLLPEAASRPRSAEVLAPQVTAYLAAVDERAHEARVATADARARVRGLLLAVSALVLALFAGGGWWWMQQQARARIETASKAVRGELEKVLTMGATARAAPIGATEPWVQALAAARGAETLALTVEADADARARAQSLRSEIERDATAAQAEAARDQRDRAMVERLQETRGTEQDPGFTTREDFAQAFRDYGIDVTALPIEEAIARIQGSGIRDALAVALDYWAAIDGVRAPQLLAIVHGADADPWRARLRSAKSGDELRALADETDVGTLPVEGSLELIYALASKNAPDAAIAVAERVAQDHPDDFSIRMVLADVLMRVQPPRLEDALRHATAAVALRPRSWDAWRRSGTLFAEAERLDETLASFRRTVAIRPDDGLSHLFLAYALADARDYAEAAAECRRALAIRPGWGNALLIQGLALINLGDASRAVDVLRLAVAQFSRQNASQGGGDLVRATAGLSLALLRAGELDDALMEAERAIALDPGRRAVFAHDVRGVVLARRGDLEAGRVAIQHAIELDRGQWEPWSDLGQIEFEDARFTEAVAAFRECVRIDGKSAFAHRKLGEALQACGEFDAAVDELTIATRLAPADRDGLELLGSALREKGRLREALDALRKGRELEGTEPGAGSALPERIAATERLVALEPRLLAFLNGSATPGSAVELLDVARLCRVRRLNVASVGYFERAFASEPGLAEDLAAANREEAARVAALAASGRGDDAAAQDDGARARFGAQALAWLRDELVLRGEAIETGSDAQMRVAVARLKRWLASPDFAAVREASALEELTAPERAEWSAFWDEVRALVDRARAR